MINRRQWLQALPLAGMTPWLSARDQAGLKAQSLDIYAVKVNHRGNWILLRVGTNSGVIGHGEASHGGDRKTVELVRKYFEEWKTRSLYDLEWLRRFARPDLDQVGRPAAVALSALEQCSWDILGKLLGVPTYQLFGGRLHSTLRNYANINRSVVERTPEAFAAMARRAVMDGFDAIKMASFDGMPRDPADPQFERLTRHGIDCIAAVRETIGPDRDLLVDAHSHFDVKTGLKLAEDLEKYKLYWLEEVTPAATLSHLAAINREASMPTAGGESIYGVEDFYDYLKAEAVDIAMPDVKYCGGMLELKKISAMCEGARTPVAPHGPASPVGNLVAAHVCAGLPNFDILEYAYGEVPWRESLIDPPERLEKGYLSVPERPGLGFELNEQILRTHKINFDSL